MTDDNKGNSEQQRHRLRADPDRANDRRYPYESIDTSIVGHILQYFSSIADSALDFMKHSGAEVALHVAATLGAEHLIRSALHRESVQIGAITIYFAGEGRKIVEFKNWRFQHGMISCDASVISDRPELGVISFEAFSGRSRERIEIDSISLPPFEVGKEFEMSFGLRYPDQTTRVVIEIPTINAAVRRI